MIKINKDELRQLILDGITSEELNSRYDYSDISNMSFMFFSCSELKSIPDLDTSNVSDMRCMFYGCSKLRSIPELNTSNVSDMSRMFYGCSKLKSIPELNTSNVLDMRWMFNDCISIENINPNNFRLYDFSTLDNRFLKQKYPEHYV